MQGIIMEACESHDKDRVRGPGSAGPWEGTAHSHTPSLVFPWLGGKPSFQRPS